MEISPTNNTQNQTFGAYIIPHVCPERKVITRIIEQHVHAPSATTIGSGDHDFILTGDDIGFRDLLPIK